MCPMTFLWLLIFYKIKNWSNWQNNLLNEMYWIHTFCMCPMAFLWIFLLKNQKLNKLLQNQIIKKIASDTYETYVSDAYYSWKIYIQHIWWQYIHLYFFQYKETAMICSILNMWENVVRHIRNVCVRWQKKSILLQNHQHQN